MSSIGTHHSKTQLRRNKLKREMKVKTLLSDLLTESDEELLQFKVDLVDLLSTGKCMNITAAALELGLNPAQVRWWCRKDPDFKELCNLAKDVMAEQLEQELATWQNNFIPKMMILKGLRPEYRDNYKVEHTSPQLESLLKALNEAKEPEALPEANVIDVVPVEAE